jgi:hypothetical protein
MFIQFPVPSPLEGMGAPSTGDSKSPERRWYRSRSDREGGEVGTRIARNNWIRRTAHTYPPNAARIPSDPANTVIASTT